MQLLEVALIFVCFIVNICNYLPIIFKKINCQAVHLIIECHVDFLKLGDICNRIALEGLIIGSSLLFLV